MIELSNDGKGLGFGIIGGRSTGVMVKTILPGGAAGQVNTTTRDNFIVKRRYTNKIELNWRPEKPSFNKY